MSLVLNNWALISGVHCLQEQYCRLGSLFVSIYNINRIKCSGGKRVEGAGVQGYQNISNKQF